MRGIVARWRRAGLAARAGRPGPAWCWPTRAGLAGIGLRYARAAPALARLAHIRTVLAVRLSMEDSDAYQDGGAWRRSERRITAAAATGRLAVHVPDAEVHWPDGAGPYGGECWAVEAELTPKPLARVTPRPTATKPTGSPTPCPPRPRSAPPNTPRPRIPSARPSSRRSMPGGRRTGSGCGLCRPAQQRPGRLPAAEARRLDHRG